MSKKHIDDLRNGLFSNGWAIISEDIGDDYSISAHWVVFSIRHQKELKLAFDGLCEESVLSLEESYGCHVEEESSLSLYFSKNNTRQWKANLLKFLYALDESVEKPN